MTAAAADLLCARGCGRRADVRGLCKPHYSAKRKKWERAGLWQGPILAVGTTRRLRALVAIGYNQNDLCRASGLSASTLSHLIRGHVTRTSRTRADIVAKLYDRLSMTPGHSQESRDRAKANGWAPPLAWDDDLIDDPDGRPDIGPTNRRRTIPFPEQYTELRQLGFTNAEIADRLGIQMESLLRQLYRYGMFEGVA